MASEVEFDLVLGVTLSTTEPSETSIWNEQIIRCFRSFVRLNSDRLRRLMKFWVDNLLFDEAVSISEIPSSFPECCCEGIPPKDVTPEEPMSEFGITSCRIVRSGKFRLVVTKYPHLRTCVGIYQR